MTRPSADPSRELILDAIRRDTGEALAERGGWRASVDTVSNIGNLDITAIDALTPFEGLSVIAIEDGTPAATGSDTVAVGDVVEYQGSVSGWQIVTENANGVPPEGTRVPMAWAGEALQAPHTVGVDEGKIAVYGGTSLNPAEYIIPDDGDTITCNGGGNNNSLKNQRKFAYEGQVPTGSWVDTGGLLDTDVGNGLERDPLTGVLQIKIDGGSLNASASGVKVADLGITDAQVAAANKDGLVGVASMRTLGTGAQQAVAGTDARFPTITDGVRYRGTRTIGEIDALGAPPWGTTVVAGSAGTPAAASSDTLAIGDIAEFRGVGAASPGWRIIVAHSSNAPPAGIVLAVDDSFQTIYSPLVHSTDNAKIATFPGASLTPTLSTPSAGGRVRVANANAFTNARSYVLTQAVPSGDWDPDTAPFADAGVGLERDWQGDGRIKVDIGSGIGLEFSGNELRAKYASQNEVDTVTGGAKAVQPSTLRGRKRVLSSSYIVTPTALSADVDNWNPSGLTQAQFIRVSTNDGTARNITGIGAQEDWRMIYVANLGPGNVVIVDESASSDAANRFALNGNRTLATDEIVQLLYDGTSSRWRVMG